MINRMKKILLIGAEKSKEEIIKKIQRTGVLHIEPYKGSVLKKQTDKSDIAEAESILSLYKLVCRIEEEKKEVVPSVVSFSSIEEGISILKTLDEDLVSSTEKVQVLINEKEDLSVWGKFSIDDIKDIEKRSGIFVQFWEVPAKFADTVDFSGAAEVFEIKHEAMRHYFVTFSKSKLHLDNCLEEKIEKDLIQIESEIEYLKKHSVELLSKIKSFSLVKNDIYKAYIAALDRYNFEKAYYSSVEALGDVFVYQGWVPEKELSVLEKSVSSDPVSISSVEPEPDEVQPTFIKNKKFSGVGQELVEFYDTPSYKDWDPSSFVFLSFIIFFAMIMGDGGYGIVLFLVTLYAAIKVKKPGVKAKRMLAMAFILSIATIGYGVMTGSFFSVTESNPVFGKLLQFKLFNSGSVDKETLDNTMRVSIIIGMIHISLSLFLKTLRLIFSEKSFIVPLSNIAWIVAIWTYFFFYGNSFAGIESGQDIQKYILYCCGGVVFLTSSGSLNPLKIFAGGLLGLYNGVQFFSDILSYLRIFALGLSGALIAQTFNNIASSMSDMGSFYMALAVIVSILGHLLNLGLSIMSAVIHGLRLNYLEYYRWSFDGGGKPYKPLKSLLEQ
ncbi:MAG: hypothetical protein KAZ87_02475 [Spirochaetes bacterium]|nr:hypothetical protein [Spirochaetota bacterium]